MADTDYTLTSPNAVVSSQQKPLLAITILWHSDLARVGEQYVGGHAAGTLKLGRLTPTFGWPGQTIGPLGDSTISRDAIDIVRDDADGLSIHLPISKMVVEINGVKICSNLHLNAKQIKRGVVLGLGGTVLLCVHWMYCLPKPNDIESFVGVGNAAIKVRDQLKQVAKTNLSVLLLGETGTGKEVAAQAIHSLSERSTAPLVSVNMAALNDSLAGADLFGAVKGAYTGALVARKGFFAEAENATLFLDEIGNTPDSVQPMLLRVLQTGEYRPLGAQRDEISTARIITATDQDLESDHFNKPLLRRLEGFVIKLPPLRSRREDIGVLIVHLLKNFISSNPGHHSIEGLSFSLVSELVCYKWPGNIRQLNQILKRILLALSAGDEPSLYAMVKINRKPDQAKKESPANRQPISNSTVAPRRKLKEIGSDEVLAAMEKFGNIKAAAQELRVSRPSLYKLIADRPQLRELKL